MSKHGREYLEVTCPCCGTHMRIDVGLGKVIAHEVPSKHGKSLDLNHVSRLLEKEAERRETLFKQGAEEQKSRSQLLERKFEESLKKTKDEPVAPPARDIDLD